MEKVGCGLRMAGGLWIPPSFNKTMLPHLAWTVCGIIVEEDEEECSNRKASAALRIEGREGCWGTRLARRDED